MFYRYVVYFTFHSLNPDIDVGQAHGAFVMGIGLCLTEKTRYDPKSGRNLTNNTWVNHRPVFPFFL